MLLALSLRNRRRNVAARPPEHDLGDADVDAGTSAIGPLPCIGNTRAAVDDALRQVREGGGLARALDRAKLFPPLVIHLIESGEASGNLDMMLARAAEAQTRELENWVKALTALMEPLMILVMGVVVGFIVLAMLLPIFQMNQLLR